MKAGAGFKVTRRHGAAEITESDLAVATGLLAKLIARTYAAEHPREFRPFADHDGEEEQ